jgi:cytochrome c
VPLSSRVLGLVLLPLLSGAARAGEEPLVVGRALLETNCAACHAIDPIGDSPHAEAPPFRDLHLRYEVEWLSEALVEGLVSGHPDMPEFEFDPIQAEAIVAYLKSLHTEGGTSTMPAPALL